MKYKKLEKIFDTLKKGRASIATSDCELYTYSDIQIRLAVAVQFMVDLWLLLKLSQSFCPLSLMTTLLDIIPLL